MVFVMISIASASARRIAEILDETSTIHNPDHPVTDVRDGEVRFEHVDFQYKDEDSAGKVLNDINLVFPTGSTVGILGATGSAKE